MCFRQIVLENFNLLIIKFDYIEDFFHIITVINEIR